MFTVDRTAYTTPQGKVTSRRTPDGRNATSAATIAAEAYSGHVHGPGGCRTAGSCRRSTAPTSASATTGQRRAIAIATANATNTTESE
jgi:hypothetical protein